MIYTCTINPSIDYYISLNELSVGKVHRGHKLFYLPGGKGLNVSIVLSRLQVPNIALGFYGGKYGMMLMDLLREEAVKTDFIKIQGETRQNIKIRGIEETDINTEGPEIKLFELKLLLNKIETLNENDYLIVAGKSVNVLNNDVYLSIGEVAKRRKVKLIVDASNQDLSTLLLFSPFLIKPNLEELEALSNQKFSTHKEMIEVCQELIRKFHITYILLSLGKDGALLVSQGNALYEKAAIGNVVNTVGAGDSLLAGFIGSYVKSLDLEDSLRLGVVCGSATAFKDTLATYDDIVQLGKF